MIVSKIKRGGAASARHVSSGMHMRMNLYFISSSPARQQLSCVPLVSSKDIEFPTRVCQWMTCSSRGRGPATSAVLPVRSATSATLEKAMKKVVEIFGHPLFVSINQMLFFYAADTVSVRIATIRIHLIAFRCLIAFFELL